MKKTVDEIVKDIIGESRSWSRDITYGKKANGDFFVKSGSKLYYDGPNAKKAKKSLLEAAEAAKEDKELK